MVQNDNGPVYWKVSGTRYGTCRPLWIWNHFTKINMRACVLFLVASSRLAVQKGAKVIIRHLL